MKSSKYTNLLLKISYACLLPFLSTDEWWDFTTNLSHLEKAWQTSNIDFWHGFEVDYNWVSLFNFDKILMLDDLLAVTIIISVKDNALVSTWKLCFYGSFNIKFIEVGTCYIKFM